MTLEAWVKTIGLELELPDRAILKEQTGQLVYALYSSTNNGQPDGEAAIGASNRSVSGPGALPTGTWSYLTLQRTTARHSAST